jgi:hypothetical protein
MKNILKLSLLSIIFAFASCKDNKMGTNDKQNTEVTAENQLYSCPMHPEVTGNKDETCSVCGMGLTEAVVGKESVVEEVKEMEVIKSQSAFSIDAVLDGYLKLKNALTKDDSKGAANAAKELDAVLNNLDTDKIEDGLKKQYATIADAAELHSANISDNDGKIEDQRKDFALLSNDVHNLTKMFKTDKKLYQDYCPMYDQGKSGYWISETKDIKNPYYGSEMLTCGGITNEW